MAWYLIDDVFSDTRPGSEDSASYVPSAGQWDPVGGSCSKCGPGANFTIPIDATKAHNGSWHTATMSPGEGVMTIATNFTGA